jgi:hypothetical protein
VAFDFSGSLDPELRLVDSSGVPPNRKAVQSE